MGEKVDDVLHKLDSWCNAYPENLFPEPDQADLNWLHETRRGLCDRISASMGRHMVKHMREMADAIREEVAQHERIVAGLEARLAEAAEIASLARDYVSSDLVFKRDAFKGYEHCSDVTDVEADLSRIDAFLAQTAEGVKGG